MDPKLAEFRRQIDAIDDQLIGLLNQRAALVARIIEWKATVALPTLDSQREGAILARAKGQATGALSGEAMERIFRVILEETKS